MTPELPIDDAGHVPFEVDEAALFAEIAGTAGSRDAERDNTMGRLGGAANPAAAPEPIQVDEFDRLTAAADREGPALRAAVAVSAVIGACGLAWIVAGTLVSGRSSGSAEPIAQASNPTSSDSGSSRGDRLQTAPIAGAKRKTGGPGPAELQQGQKLPPPPPPPAARKRSVAAVPASASLPSRRSPPAPQHTASMELPAQEPDAPKLVPVPDTRPITIEGWTVRDVASGTAVLEGPNGVFRVAAGNTVPALGRVESIVRWGNRWIVATSSGLISTP
jgi:hypothetical protein